MATVLIVIAIAVPLAGVAAYLALLIWAAREDGRDQRALEEWQRAHRPRLIERRLRERERRSDLPPRRPPQREGSGPRRRA